MVQVHFSRGDSQTIPMHEELNQFLKNMNDRGYSMPPGNTGGIKPVALLCKDYASGIQYLLSKYKLVEYNTTRAVADNGKIYLLFVDAQKMLAHEFSDYDAAPGAGENPHWTAMYETVRSRTRTYDR